MPGCPQMKTGLTTATCKRSSGNCAGVTVTEACIPCQGKFYPGDPSPKYSRPWLQGVIRRGGRRRTWADKDMRRLGGVFNMSADANIKTIMSVYEAFGRGDVAAILDAVTDDVDWAAEAAGSAAPWYGVRHGKDAVAVFFSDFGSAMEVEEFTPVSFAANDTDVLAVVRFRARSRSTGRTAQMNLHHYFKFR